MPPQTRGIKSLKENITASVKNKAKNNVKINRKPLADKTNSASDDNVSGLSSNKIMKTPNESPEPPINVKQRSRRNRRLPTRYEENNILKNLSNFNSLSPQEVNSPETPKLTPTKTDFVKPNPHKTPLRISNSPLVSKRPRRICRLPSKFDGQFVSPIKNGSIEPSHSSTPISHKLKKPINWNDLRNDKLQKKVQNTKEVKRKGKANENVVAKRATEFKVEQSAANVTLLTNSKKLDKSNTLEMKIKKKPDTKQKKITVNTSNTNQSKTSNSKDPTQNASFRLLEDKKKTLKRDSSKLDVYEFTFDPNDEPPPQKKKKKKYTKNPSKPKKVVKSVYERNLEKALAALKNTVSSKSKIQLPIQQGQIQNTDLKCTKSSVPTTNQINHNISEVSENKYTSIRVEDIAKQFQDTNDYDHNDIDYSPVNSPHHAPLLAVHLDVGTENSAQPVLLTSVHSNGNTENPGKPLNNKDPLNLQDDLSFFDEQPVASSSMNVSTRHPLASPWRVEFNNLPIKWQVNSYVKSNMTPAIERSFINYNDNQKKHVYTNIITEANNSLPQIVDNPQPHTSNLRQTSIMSFIKEVVEKNENKKKKKRIIKNNSLFDDITQASESINPETNKDIPEVIIERSNTSSEDIQSENENAHLQDNSVNLAIVKDIGKLSEKEKGKDITYFGFDDSENQENVSPAKKKIRKKTLKTQNRKVLQVINSDVDPSKKISMPLAAISKPTRIPNQLDKHFDAIKSAMEPPTFREQNNNKNIAISDGNTDLLQSNIDEDECHSVHLFEDIELVHYLKPPRKSYGKSKKVTFHQNPAVNNQDSDIEYQESVEEDDLDDLSFKLPSVKDKKITKKKTKKQQKSKKEEKEVEEWAAGFNSMCEDIEEFDLVVE